MTGSLKPGQEGLFIRVELSKRDCLDGSFNNIIFSNLFILIQLAKRHYQKLTT